MTRARGRLLRLPALVASLACAACGVEYAAPPEHVDDARFGRLARAPDTIAPKGRVCRGWAGYFESIDPYALSHTSYPETDPQDACYTPVTHEGVRGAIHPDAPPARGCAYPDEDALAHVEALASALERRDPATLGAFFSCSLTASQRDAAVRQNVRVLRALAADAHAGRTWPYAAVVTPGHGLPEQAVCSLSQTLPGEACVPLSDADFVRLGGNVPRSERAAQALKGGVAPIVIASGGAVHSCMVEAFAIAQLVSCTFGVAGDRVLVEPCAEHTHTNLRNAGRWIAAIGGRAAYLLTDDFIQSRYFQDWSGFELLLGSVDQRSLRDFGYVVGSWRQASRGVRAGFWFTPYRFWAEPRDGLGSFTCDDWDPATP